jgi:hypothetical protein
MEPLEQLVEVLQVHLVVHQDQEVHQVPLVLEEQVIAVLLRVQVVLLVVQVQQEQQD